MENTTNAIGLIKTIANKLRDEKLENRDSDEMSTASFLAQVKEQEDAFLSCDFVKKVKHMLPCIEDRVLFYDICKDNFIDGHESDLEATLKDLFNHRSQVLSIMKNFIREKSVLQKCGLVECRQDNDEYKLVKIAEYY